MAPGQRGALRVGVGFTLRSTVLHFATYFVFGALSYMLVARRYWEGPNALPGLRNPQSAFVQHWFWRAQIVRGVLHGLVLLPLRGALLEQRRWGGLVIAALLLVIGSVAGISGAIETWVYTTTFQPALFLAHLPEVVLQTLAYGYLLLAWERRVERRAAA